MCGQWSAIVCFVPVSTYHPPLQIIPEISIIYLDINECDTGRVCDRNAQCTNTAGSFICTCNSGYIAAGAVCTGKC